jgi:hypothetical protein
MTLFELLNKVKQIHHAMSKKMGCDESAPYNIIYDDYKKLHGQDELIKEYDEINQILSQCPIMTD